MKPRAMFTAVVLTALLALPQLAGAATVHNLDCKNCHVPSLSVADLGGANVCLSCHDEPTTILLNDNTNGTITSGFGPWDASNAMGNNSAAVSGAGQTSHNWAAADTQPAAGAVAPNRSSHPQFYSRQGSSTGRVTCARCHNPHADSSNPQLLVKGPGSAETMCTACHVPWAQGAGMSNITHPVGINYAAVMAAKPTKYKPGIPENDKDINTPSPISLYDGKVVCGTCHQVHFADSNPVTPDSPDAWDDLSFAGGDGKLLRSYGRVNGDAVKSSTLCQVCHVYETHGGAHTTIGCLDCHGGHSPSGNYYVLRPQVTDLAWVPKNEGTPAQGPGDSDPLGYTTPTSAWMNAGGTGYCQGCHTIPTTVTEHTVASGNSSTCGTCHNHTTDFMPTCNTCHGYAPSTNTAGGPTGYAINASLGFNYSTSSVAKNESQTPHQRHANGNAVNGDYAYACKECHYQVSGVDTAPHNKGSYQDVTFNGGGTLAWADGATPSYVNTGTGSCATVYCHSNGGPRGSAPTYSTVNPVWAGGIDDITTCNVCHGNDAASMTLRGNSMTHQAHLAKGYQCNVCHTNTSLTSSSLVPAAIGSDHVDGGVDVAFSNSYNLGAAQLGSGSYGDTNGTCGIYCHSNGTTQVTPDWDLSGTGTCGTCHQVSVAGSPVGTGPVLNGSHTAHVFAADGPKLGCNYCHTNGGSGADHVNGEVSLHAGLQTTCNSCHGATAATTAGNDRQPIWADAASVDCATCHVGVQAVISARTAPAKNSFYSLGHGDPTLTAGTPNCAGCHTLTADHIDGATDSNMLTGGATANDAFCQTCHAGKGSHYNNTATAGGTSTTADSCAVCHEVHGEGMGTNTDVMLIVGSGFTDKEAAASYWNASFTGVCQVCHDPTDGTGSEIKHYNRTTADGHNSGTKCVNCHTHDDTPAFKPGAGTSCDSCHGFPPATAAHALHAPDSLALDTAGTVLDTADRSACTHCHTGANLYTYDQGADAASGTAGRQNHGVGEATQEATLLASVGYSATNLNCTTACHASTVADGAWNDTALNCDSCHGNPPASGGSGTAHAKHIATGQTCATCHVSVPADTAHISVKTGATELARVQNAAQALADEADVVVTTWNDTNNTCGNAACHNPSADGKLADWDTSTSSCTLCHRNDVASGQAMQTGSHTSHINNAAVIGDNRTCVDCHTDVAGNMAHRNGIVNVLGSMSYNGEVAVPNTAYGTCSTLVCHNDVGGKNGGGGSISQTPTWGTDVPNDCGICHNFPSDNGDHLLHMNAERTALGMGCVTCHANTVLSNSSIKPGGSHLNGVTTNVAYSGNYNGAAVSSDYNSIPDPSTCTASCHNVNPRPWTEPNSCETCHGDLSYVGGAHVRHINITGGIENDVTDCAVCHGDMSQYTYTPLGNHQNNTVNLLAGISDSTCASACHASTAGVDGFWTDADGLNCDSCHGNPPTADNHTKHIAAGLTCSNCHIAVDAVGTHPLTHNHAKDTDADTIVTQGESLMSRGKDFLTEVVVDDAAYNAGNGSTWINSNVTDDGGNTCANTLCHNPSGGNTVDWDEDTSSCVLCHGENSAGADITTGSHNNHLHADAKFGIVVTCTRCHPDNTGNMAHFLSGGVPNGEVKFGGYITTQYQGEVSLPNSGYGTCTTNTCHNNGKGGAPISAFTWGTTVATDCQFCHDDPPSSGRHQTHLGATVSYGPYAGVASTNCGDCHNANNDLTMTGMATHINGVINFADGNSVASGGIVADANVARCNNCHGAGVSANINSSLAKAQWNTANRLACESCHGTYGAANSLVDNSGIAAPARAGTGYLNSGHGKAGVSKGCNECHDSTVAHISATLGDANRLDTMTKGPNTFNYGVLAEQNGWCGACHSTTMYGHFANTQTGGGTSDDGLYCSICHDPHGQNGDQDAMVADNINGTPVTGFTDRTDRASYGNASFSGVCQVCHDGAEVPHFNRSTDETATHNSGNCLTCHKHTDNPAFQASGCSGCHGGGYPVYANNYWPDSSNARAENTAGRHSKHMQRLALATYNETLDQLLTDNGNGTTDVKQKTLCAYCHNAPGTDADHGTTLPAEVNAMANLWNGNADNGIWAAGVNSGNCSNVNCHNNQTTPTGFGWYGGNASACTMCHVAGNVDDLAKNNIHPNSGLHKVVNTSTVQSHNHTMAGGCTSCHLAAQPNTHIDGVAVADSNANTDRFLNDGTTAGNAFDYIEGATNQASCGSTVGLIAGCHSDLGNWRRLWSKDADSTDTLLGSNRCNTCHGQPTGGSSLGWRDGYNPAYALSSSVDATIGHNRININDTSKHANCEFCHVAPAGPYNTYVYATMHENGLVETNNGAGVGYDSGTGSCTNFCHPSGSTKTMAGSQIWNNNPLLGASPTCGECHDPSGGALLPPYDSTIGYGGGSHDKHVFGTATIYADTGNNSTAANYNYGCANCHPNSITYHFNGTIDLSLNNTHGGPLKSLNNVANDTGGFSAVGPKGARTTTCSAAYCHSDGKGNFNVTPNWYGGTFGAGDPCAKCHLNSPDGTSHQPHNVGIHYNNVYTGTTNVVKDASNRQNAHGVAATSTTISCQLCHNDTITVKVNAGNTVCATCHSDTNTPATGNEAASISNKSKHVSGSKDVKFEAVAVLSRAQLREPLADAPEVDDNWLRMNGYKVDNTSHDHTWDKVGGVERPLDTATMYETSTKNCTVACHNNIQIGWGSTTISCSNCHSQLPK